MNESSCIRAVVEFQLAILKELYKILKKELKNMNMQQLNYKPN